MQAIVKPGDRLAHLSGVGAPMERVGRQGVRSAGATPYRSFVDMTKVDGTPRALAVELSLDDARRVVRLRYPTNGDGPITYDFFDFGAPVESPRATAGSGEAALTSHVDGAKDAGDN